MTGRSSLRFHKHTNPGVVLGDATERTPGVHGYDKNLYLHQLSVVNWTKTPG